MDLLPAGERGRAGPRLCGDHGSGLQAGPALLPALLLPREVQLTRGLQIPVRYGTVPTYLPTYLAASSVRYLFGDLQIIL